MKAPLPKLLQIPPTVASVADYEPLARDRMTEQAWAYLADGAADETTLHENRVAYRRLRFRPACCRIWAAGDTRLELFGRIFEFPILLAPVAFQMMFHPEGERATAFAASAMGAGIDYLTRC